jgi:hypothetical protein
MRTLIIIAGGIVLVGLFAFAGSRFGGGAQSMVMAAKIFIPFWLIAALINMWVGVSRAGYSIGEESPIFLAIFLIPAAVAAFIWWKY